MKMRYMNNEEYTSRFLDLLMYLRYLKEDKVKIQRFISGFLIVFKDNIEFDEPRSLEEPIIKLKHYYEQSNHDIESRKGWKGKYKAKGK